MTLSITKLSFSLIFFSLSIEADQATLISDFDMTNHITFVAHV